MALWGNVPTEMMEGLKMIPIRVRYPKADFDQLGAIRRLPIYLASIDRMLPLEEVAQIQKSQGRPILTTRT